MTNFVWFLLAVYVFSQYVLLSRMKPVARNLFTHICNYCCLWDTWTGAVLVTVTNHIISTYPICGINFKKILRNLNSIGSRQSYPPPPAFHSCHWPNTLKPSHITDTLLSLHYLSIHLDQFRHPEEHNYIPSIRGKVRTKFPYLLFSKRR